MTKKRRTSGKGLEKGEQGGGGGWEEKEEDNDDGRRDERQYSGSAL